MDELFNNNPVEWWHGQEMSSAHNADSIKEFDLPASYVLFCYPRDNTPVCTGELIDLQKHLDRFNPHMPVIAASTDSPETHNIFFNNPEAFPADKVLNIEYPIITIGNGLTAKGHALILDEYGYCKRIAIVVVNDIIKAVYQTDNNVARDIILLRDLVDSVIKK